MFNMFNDYIYANTQTCMGVKLHANPRKSTAEIKGIFFIFFAFFINFLMKTLTKSIIKP